MLRNLIYAILLGVGMAACLADRDKNPPEAEVTGEEAAMTGSPEEDAPDPAAFTIAKGRVGDIRVGMPVTEMRTQVPQHFILTDTLLHLEGQAYTAYRLREEGSSTGLLIEQKCETDCQVWRIRVSSPSYKTAAGVGAGATFSQVRQHYSINFLGLSEAGLVAVAEQDGISFVLDNAALPREKLSRLKPADIPANTPVKQIFIY
ncbi:mechanosensitive ion channel protein MscS [Botryobacter ruber]|uniref:mechanosensitive ion channel protein MscS n=1 Tax=Botryobacter ruber TaxID=2171629 RepID=UPI000E0B07F2|nr:mechanosensitive ion channel protein MscS [Botryobacter ruber]